MDPMQMFQMQQYLRQRNGGMFGGQQMQLGAAPMQGLPQMNGPIAQQQGGDNHHGFLHKALPYLAMGLLPMLFGGGGGGGPTQFLNLPMGPFGILGKKAF